MEAITRSSCAYKLHISAPVESPETHLMNNGDIARGTSIYIDNIEVSKPTRYAKEHRLREAKRAR